MGNLIGGEFSQNFAEPPILLGHVDLLEFSFPKHNAVDRKSIDKFVGYDTTLESAMLNLLQVEPGHLPCVGSKPYLLLFNKPRTGLKDTVLDPLEKRGELPSQKIENIPR